MYRIDRIVQNPVIFPDFILYILSINVTHISDDPLTQLFLSLLFRSMLAYASTMSRRPNIYDVARVAGVSRTVVSLVTNGKADQYRIARETQDRVRAAVLQTGYVPNLFIRNMYLQRGAISRGGGAGAVTDPVKVAAVINQALASAGYQMKVSSLSADQTAGLLLLLSPSSTPHPSPQPSTTPAPPTTNDQPPTTNQRLTTNDQPTTTPVIVPLPIPVVPAPCPAPVIPPPQPTPVPTPPPETPAPSTPSPSEREGGDSSPPSSFEPVIAEPPAAEETIPASEPAPAASPPEPAPEPVPPAIEPIPATPIVIQREGGDSSPQSSPEPSTTNQQRQTTNDQPTTTNDQPTTTPTPEPTPVIVLPVEPPPPPEPIPAPPIILQGEGGDSSPPSSSEPTTINDQPSTPPPPEPPTTNA